ncbi:MAG TPA: acyl-CoA dehydrogenase [Polyangiaceae bacterium]|nr:acyl-CoA dehydrogenase [Polyangiaceae bacterium]
MENPLLSDKNVDFLLYDVLNVEQLCELTAFREHGRETFDLFLAGARRMARQVLLPSYRRMDAQAPELRDGRVRLHPLMREIYPQLLSLGLVNATRPAQVGGQQLPITVASLASAYLMAGNGSAYSFVGLTSAAAHLLEAFGSDWLKAEFMSRLHTGEWTGTMALTEPHAGSSLADVTTRATPTDGGYYLVHGAKIFISGADHDLTENVVQMTLARIDGAPPGIKGISLFAIPNQRPEGGRLVPNDVHVAGAVHKLGFRGIPSLILSFGERDDCRGWLVGERERGIAHMFQMMNEARIMVGMGGVATASVAYYESLDYARTRPQGRGPAGRDPQKPQVAIVEHADVRRMLLRQKAIVEGGLALLATTAMQADFAAHADDAPSRRRAALLLDFLTPIAKSFPAEWGFESNVLAMQVHGGYGYSSEYLPEAWLRDQKLNSIHEGTTGIQGLDLLGRKAVAEGGAALGILAEEIARTIARARSAGIEDAWCTRLDQAMTSLIDVTQHLAGKGLAGDVEGMLLHSADYLGMACVVTVAWQWLLQAAVAREAMNSGRAPVEFYEGKLTAAQYWLASELPRAKLFADLCRSGEDSYARMKSDWF